MSFPDSIACSAVSGFVALCFIKHFNYSKVIICHSYADFILTAQLHSCKQPFYLNKPQHFLTIPEKITNQILLTGCRFIVCET